MLRVPHHPEFGVDSSPIYATNDGRLRIDAIPEGFAVVDTADMHVELFTRSRVVAEGIIAGYDYREYLNRGDAS